MSLRTAHYLVLAVLRFEIATFDDEIATVLGLSTTEVRDLLADLEREGLVDRMIEQ
jgi:transcription initiation factor IIE alpha subunit